MSFLLAWEIPGLPIGKCSLEVAQCEKSLLEASRKEGESIKHY